MAAAKKLFQVDIYFGGRVVASTYIEDTCQESAMERVKALPFAFTVELVTKKPC